MIEYSVSYGNSSGNLVTAFGDVAKCEDYIYFSSHYAKGLWKYNVQTGEKTLLLPYTANYINIVDGWIYCLLSDSQHKKLGLYRLKTDGTELKMLTDMDLTQINVVNHKIYGIAWNGGYPYCLNLDGSELTKLSDYGFEDLNVTEHYLYMRNNKIRRMDIDTRTIETVIDISLFTEHFIVHENWIYYNYNYSKNGAYQWSMFKAPADGSGPPIELFEDVYEFNVSDGYIYYTKLGESGVFRATIEGEKLGKISDDFVNVIAVLDGELYCYEYSPLVIIRMKPDGSDKEVISLIE